MPRLKGKGRDVVTARNNFVLKLVKCSESHDCGAQKRCHFLNFHANDPLYKFAKVIRKILGMIQPHSICKFYLLSLYGAIVIIAAGVRPEVCEQKRAKWMAVISCCIFNSVIIVCRPVGK